MHDIVKLLLQIMQEITLLFGSPFKPPGWPLLSAYIKRFSSLVSLTMSPSRLLMGSWSHICV